MTTSQGNGYGTQSIPHLALKISYLQSFLGKSFLRMTRKMITECPRLQKICVNLFKLSLGF